MSILFLLDYSSKSLDEMDQDFLNENIDQFVEQTSNRSTSSTSEAAVEVENDSNLKAKALDISIQTGKSLLDVKKTSSKSVVDKLLADFDYSSEEEVFEDRKGVKIKNIGIAEENKVQEERSVTIREENVAEVMENNTEINVCNLEKEVEENIEYSLDVYLQEERPNIQTERKVDVNSEDLNLIQENDDVDVINTQNSPKPLLKIQTDVLEWSTDILELSTSIFESGHTPNKTKSVPTRRLRSNSFNEKSETIVLAKRTRSKSIEVAKSLKENEFEPIRTRSRGRVISNLSTIPEQMKNMDDKKETNRKRSTKNKKQTEKSNEIPSEEIENFPTKTRSKRRTSVTSLPPILESSLEKHSHGVFEEKDDDESPKKMSRTRKSSQSENSTKNSLIIKNKTKPPKITRRAKSAIETYSSSRRLTRRQVKLLEQSFLHSTQDKSNTDNSDDENRGPKLSQLNPIILLEKSSFEGVADPDEQNILQRSPVSSVGGSLSISSVQIDVEKGSMKGNKSKICQYIQFFCFNYCVINIFFK